MATMNVGDINRRLGISITGDLIANKLGIEPDHRDKRAMLWDESRYPAICDALAKYVVKAKNNEPVDKPAPAPKKAAAPAPAPAASGGGDWDDEDGEDEL